MNYCGLLDVHRWKDLPKDFVLALYNRKNMLVSPYFCSGSAGGTCVVEVRESDKAFLGCSRMVSQHIQNKNRYIYIYIYTNMQLLFGEQKPMNFANYDVL